MRTCLLALFVLFVFSSVAEFFAMQERPATKFSVSVNLVEVPISIFDDRGLMVTDLRREYFRIWEDKALQEIRSFGRDTKPVSLILLLDASKSGKEDINNIKDVAEEFTKVLSSGDRVCIITFDEQVILILDWTDDMKKVRKAIGKVRFGLRTALYDAMYLAAQKQLMDTEGRKAIILLTDCRDTQSIATFKEASQKIIQSQASLYVISKTVLIRRDLKLGRKVIIYNEIYRKLFGDSEDLIDLYFDRWEEEMTELAEKTGGRSFFPEDYLQIGKYCSEIVHEIKNKYYLTYISNQHLSPDTYHRIAIEYLKPSSRMIYRKGYYYQPRLESPSWVLEPTLK
jgi:Ca-activated chloride channel family protein